MSDDIKIPVFENFKDSAHLTKDKYEETYKFAFDNPSEILIEIIFNLSPGKRDLVLVPTLNRRSFNAPSTLSSEILIGCEFCPVKFES